jgi:NodT family efflux transporter outer membrane factor (OMF) lipoprotein
MGLMLSTAPMSVPARRAVLAILVASAGVAAGCRPYEPHAFERGPAEVPAAFNAAGGLLAEVPPAERLSAGADPETVAEPWWRTFGDADLDVAVDAALEANLDLRQAWSRLRQAAAESVIAGAPGRPTLDATGSASASRLGDRDPDFPPDGSPGNRWDERYALGLGLSWEVDLWGRLAAREDAALLRAMASRADVSDTALLIAASVVEAWFDVQEQGALLNLLEEQLESSRTLLGLTELRFSLGEGSSVAVLQQRTQVAATESQLPVARARLAAASHRLAVLLGRTPGDLGPFVPGPTLPALPLLPPIVSPGEVLQRRPDVRAALARLDASDQDVAEAVADRLPRLSLSLSYDWTSAALGAAFQRDIATAAAGVVAPLVDGGRRRAEVERRQAIVQRQLDALGVVVLEALREVEDALAQERHQRELLRRRDRQLALSRETLDETRRRYANGLGNYIDVIVAQQALQQLERQVLGERAALVTNRARLHRALGGLWMEQLAPPTARDLETFAAATPPGASASATATATTAPAATESDVRAPSIPPSGSSTLLRPEDRP